MSHDNAFSHKAGSKTSFFNKLGDYLLEHPPYSPYIATCVFFLIPRLKKNLAGRKYTSPQKFGAATFDLFRGVPETDYEKALKDWIKRLNHCISIK